MGIGFIVFGILIFLFSFFIPDGVGTALLVSIILIALGIIINKKKSKH